MSIFIYPMLNVEKDKMDNKIRNTLTYLKNKKLIENLGSDTKSKWYVK